MTNRGTQSNPHRFSIAHYRRTILRYQDAGYSLVPFRDLDTASSQRVVVMRHDIDISPEYALPVLTAESMLGIRSTVLVRTSAPGYRLSDPDVAAAVRQMDSDGFEIGLHYEFGPDPAKDVDDLTRQRDELEQCIGHSVRGAAPHRVAIAKRPPPVDTVKSLGLYDAFDPSASSGLKYISDSRRRWREGCFCEWVGKAERLQVLTHPVWWRPGSLKQMDETLKLL